MLLFNYAIVYVTIDSCNYKLEKDDLCVSELFEMLDSVKVEIGILDWGIKMTTLEDGKISMDMYMYMHARFLCPPPPSLPSVFEHTLSSTVKIKERKSLLPFVLGGCHANSVSIEEKYKYKINK